MHPASKALRLFYIIACLLLADAAGPGAVLAEPKNWNKTTEVWSNDTLSLGMGLELRLRYESLDGYTIKRYDPTAHDDVLLSRIRFNTSLATVWGPSFFVQLQDSRFWLSMMEDDPSSKSPYQNLFDLRQAYAQWLGMGASPLGLRLGRQTLVYGDSRIFSQSNWGNVGSYTWDIGKAMWDTPAFKIDGFWGQRVYYNKSAFDSEHYDYDVGAVYAQINPAGPIGLDLFYVRKYDLDGVYKGETGTGDLDVNTIGFYIHGKSGALKWRGTLALQGGEIGGDRLEAWGGNITVDYTWALPLRPGVEAAVSYASGDNDPHDGQDNTFQQVFGAVDRYYGLMNLFCWSNLQDYQLGLRLEPFKGFHMGLDWHFFSLAQATDAWYYRNGSVIRRDETGQSGTDLGQELDFFVRWNQTKHIEWRSGLCRFFPGEFIQNTGPSGDATWFFLQVRLSY